MDQVKLVHYFVYFLGKIQLYYSGPNSLASVFANPSNSYNYLTYRVFNVDDDISVQFFFMKGIYAAQCLNGF